jgi:hypothetical protein
MIYRTYIIGKMEDDTMTIHTPIFEEEKYKKQIDLIEAASKEAQGIIDYSTAHNEEILLAIDIVEQFLRKRHRLCYGGQAINAHLPAKYKFYDPEYSIPDYDFFTPQQDDDIRLLSKMLRKAGFAEISAREGMHEGTIKIYVNYIPVADITVLDTKLYQLLSEKEFIYDGISYLDANTLRMFMYLELSRPKGEVARWKKVYERLMLLNQYIPINSGDCKKSIKKNLLSKDEVNAIMHYCIKEGRIFAGADLVGFYRSSFTGKQRASWLLYARKPIYLYTADIEKDLSHFRYELRHLGTDALHVHRVQAMGGDLIPQMAILTRNKYPVLVLVSQSACHSFYTVPLRYENNIRIATLDTLITLYFSMSLLKYKYMDLASLECLAQELVEISYRSRDKPEIFPFPFISMECSGNQKRLASLIREKVKRFNTTKKKRLQKLIADAPLRKSTSRNQKWADIFYKK